MKYWLHALSCSLIMVGVDVHAHDVNAAIAPSEPGSVVSMQVPNETTVRFLQDNFDVWLARSQPDGSGLLDVWVSDEDSLRLDSLGFRYQTNNTLSANMRQVFDLQLGRETSSLRTIPSYACYRTVEETFDSLQLLAERYPNLARVQDFGSSLQQTLGLGGYPMKALVIENVQTPAPTSESKPTLLLIAAIHAREYATAEIATRFAEHLLDNYQSDANTRWLLDTRRVVVVPLANPDGRKIAENGVLQRRNLRMQTCATPGGASGVDLNRNSSFLWGGTGSSTSGCSDTFRGAASASEPETQALQNLIAQTFVDARGPNPTDAAPVNTSGIFISLHSYADMVLFPWGANSTAAPNRSGLQTLARKFGFYTNYRACQPPVSGCLYAASGTTDDQSYGELGVASFTFEVGNNGFFESCTSFESATWPKNLNALNFALQATRRPYLEPSGPEVFQVQALRNVLDSDGMLTVTATVSDARSFGGLGVADAAQPIVSVRVFLTDPNYNTSASGFETATIDGGFDSATESVRVQIPLAVVGQANTIWLRALDANGAAGPVLAAAVRNAGEFNNGFE
jgi:carboxypeptidase T